MCIEKTDFLHLAASVSSAEEAVKAIEENKIQLIFLDIEMPTMSGLDFLKTVKTTAQIVVVSGKKEYAADAFDYNVTDYLVKPVDYERFLKAAFKANEISVNLQVGPNGKGDFFIKKDSRLLRLNPADILWIEALADYVTIHVGLTERHTILATMKSMEDKLPKSDFVRIHRSYIIRLDKIKEIEENSVSIDGKHLPISRSYKENLFKRLNLI